MEGQEVTELQNPDRFGSLELTTAVTSCSLDIHNCTDDSRLLLPSFMMYDAVMGSFKLSRDNRWKGWGVVAEISSCKVGYLYLFLGLALVWKR